MSTMSVGGREELRGLGEELINAAFRANGRGQSNVVRPQYFWDHIVANIVSVADLGLDDALSPYRDLVLLEGHGEKLLDLVIRQASKKQWEQWLECSMQTAASAGATDVLIRLLESWEHSVDDGPLPRVLMAAGDGGSVEALSALLAAGAGPLVRAVDEVTWPFNVLHRAAGKGHRKFVAKLIALGAPVDSRHFLGGTALTEAVERGHKGVALELLAAGVDVNKIHAIRFHDRVGFSLEHGDFTPLGIAVHTQDEEMVKVLLEAGADPSKGPEGFIPLHMAASLGSCVLLNSLLLAGASVNLVDADGRSALHRACAYNKHDAVDLLLRHNASVTLLCNNGLSPVDVVGTNVPALRQRGLSSSPSALHSAESSTVDAICDMLRAASAWGRRGWLVMMRSRPLAEVVTEQPNRSDADALATSALALRLAHEPSSNTADVCEEGRTPRALHDGGGARTDWSAAVVWMMRGADESLFCNIVRFL